MSRDGLVSLENFSDRTCLVLVFEDEGVVAFWPSCSDAGSQFEITSTQ